MRKYIKKLSKTAVLLVMVLTFLLSGCGKMEAKEAENEHTEEMQMGYPLTLTDQIGREVVIEKEPQSIVSGYYISTSALIALNQEDKLVGIENDADKRPVYTYSNPEILELPSLGTVKEFDLEECALLNPDLVVVPTKLEGVIPSLEALGITVVVVNPENEELLDEMIVLLGKATGSEELAYELLAYKAGKIKELQKALESEDLKKPGVYLAGNSSFLTTAGPLMYQHQLIQNAGGENVAAEITDTYWAEVSYEQVLKWNPEYIIIAADASYTVEDVKNDKNLISCEAVKNGNIYKLPNITEPLDSPVPGSFLGTLYIANVLHPESYSTDQFEAIFEEFYEIFYQFTVEKNND